MARSKKKTEEIKEKNPEKELEATPKNDSIKYKGTIGVSILKNGKVIKTNKFHNNGRYPLFQFLCECLRGNYKNAEPFRPKYISLFNVSSAEYVKYKNKNTTIDKLFNSDNRTTIGAISFKGTPYLNVSQEGINGIATLTYTFSIPFINLRNTDANAIALYGNENWDTSYINPSAYYINVNRDGDLTKLIGESLDSNYSILVDWTMTFEN